MDQTNKVAPDELVFSVGEEKAEVKEVKNLPKLNLLPESHPLLREALPVYDFQSESQDTRNAFTESMAITMRMTGGVGLSANQVGAKIRMFVMDRVDEAKGVRTELLVCYNPEVIRELEAPVPSREGCLSFPGLSLQIKRAAAVEVSFQDETGTFHELELSGMDAKVFQHELDHMNGVLFTSKVSRDILNWEREKQRKLIKKAKKSYLGRR